MAYLKFYEWEWQEFKDAWDIKLSTTETKIIFDKLIRHFKLNCRLYFKNGRSGNANRWCVKVPYRTPLGLLLHEISHVRNYQKYDNKGHNKKLKRTIRTIYNYCKKRNFWQEEIARRTEIKPPKPQPTPIEKQEKKIAKRKADLERYHKRLKYFTKLYSNKIKKANRSISSLERHLQKLQSSNTSTVTT
jgi:hypothetical protein